MLDKWRPVQTWVIALAAQSFLLKQSVRQSVTRKPRRAAPPGAAGRVFGIVTTGFNIGGLIGPPIFGWLMDHGQPRWILGLAVLFMATTAVVGLLEERRAPVSSPHP